MSVCSYVCTHVSKESTEKDVHSACTHTHTHRNWRRSLFALGEVTQQRSVTEFRVCDLMFFGDNVYTHTRSLAPNYPPGSAVSPFPLPPAQRASTHGCPSKYTRNSYFMAPLEGPAVVKSCCVLMHIYTFDGYICSLLQKLMVYPVALFGFEYGSIKYRLHIGEIRIKCCFYSYYIKTFQTIC